MGGEPTVEIKIGVNSAQVKPDLAKVQAEFVSASANITKALSSVKGLSDLKKQTDETAKAYGETQQKVASLAKEIKSGAGGAALAKDFAKAKTEAAKLKDSLSGQQQQLQQARTAMSALGVSTTSLSGQQASLRTQLDATKQKYQDLAKVASARDTLKLTPQADITGQLNSYKQAYSSLAASGKLSMAELAQAKVAVGLRIDELKKKTISWRGALIETRGELLEAGAAVVPMGLAIGQAIKFESAFANVKKVVDASPAGFQQLRSEIIGLTREIPLTASELAQIAASGGQLGMATDDIGAFVEVTAKMATAFDMTAQEAGDSIGKIKNVYRLAIGEVEGFGDTINQLGNTTASREKDIVEVMLRVGGSANQFGLAKESTAALAAAMLSLGKAPEVAATSINSLLSRMQTATMQAPPFQEALAKIGMTADEMGAQVAANPQKALDSLLGTLSELQGQERAEVLTGLFGREFQDDIGVLVGSLQTYRDALNQVADRTKYAGSMNKEFEARSETTANQLTLLKNAASEAGINLGTIFLPAVRAIVTPITLSIQATASFAQQFPILSAGLTTLGTGFLVFGTAAKLAGIAKLAIVNMAGESVTALGNLKNTAVGIKPIFANIGTVVAAFSIGWSVGTWLNQFDLVKKAGITLAHTLTMGWLQVKKAWEWMTGGNTDAVERQMNIARQTYSSMMDEINGKAKESSSVRVAEEKKVSAEVAKSASKQKLVTGEALKEMKKQYKDYADEVKKLQGEIVSSQWSLEAELREMSRSGMSDSSAWKDRKKEAEEYAVEAKKAAAEAQAAMDAGDTASAKILFEDAVELAKESKAAYKDLNKEVKDGETVVISQQQALKTSMAGVKSSGELAINILKQQQTATVGAMNALTEKSGFANLAEGMTEAEQKWLASWEKMKNDAGEKITLVKEQISGLGASADALKTVFANAFQPPEDGDWGKVWTAMESGSKQSAKAVTGDWDRVWDKWLASGSEDIGRLERQLSELIKDRSMTVRIKTVEERSSGGMIGGYHLGGAIQALATGGGVRNILAGGNLPGFGGGDTVPLWGEAGEFMINKWASLKAGLPALKHLNAGDIGGAIAELTKRMQANFGYRLGGMVQSISGGGQRLATGGAVVGGGESMTIHLNFPSGSTVPVQATPKLARQLLRELERMGFRASA